MFGPTNETISCTYTVPQDKDAWFLQGTVQFLDSVEYEVSLFSVKRERSSDTTDDFRLCLSGQWYNISGVLPEDGTMNFSVNPQDLCDHNGVMNFTAFIRGNRYGMVIVMYHEPVLMGMNARFRINNIIDNVYNLSLTKTITRASSFEMTMWDSQMFRNYPKITELCVRFLTKGIPGFLFNLLFQSILEEIPPTYHLFPFSTNPVYTGVQVVADDASALRQVSSNGNLWFTCNGPSQQNRFLKVTFPAQ